MRFPLATPRQVRAEIARQLKNCPGARWRGMVALVLLIAGSAASVSIPLQLGRIVDMVLADSGVASLARSALWLVLAAVAAASLSAAGFFVLSRISERVISQLREDMVGTAVGLPVYQVEEAGTGDLVSRSTDDVAQLSAAVTATLPLIANSTFTLAATTVALLGLDWQYLLVPVVVVPYYYYAAKIYMARAPQLYAAERAAMAGRARRVLQAIRGRASVRAFRWEDRMHDEVRQASQAVVDKGFAARRKMIALQVRVSFADFLLAATGLLVGFLSVRQGALSVGAVTAAMFMLIRLRGPVASIMRVLDSVQSGYASLARIVGVLINPPPQVEERSIPAAKGHVRFENVSFSYGSGWAVDDISFEIMPGQTVAVVGASGAGKSTVATLLAGLRTPDSGRVLIDGVEVTSLSDRQRSTRLAMVSQEVHVFSGPLREDLTIARPQASDEQLWQALETVGAYWVKDLPQGLDTEVGSRGMVLEPVKAQQLALGRIALCDPTVVVMDEATAEAGSEGANGVEAAAAAVAQNRTALVVAHNLDQAEKADVILVMEDGRIIESGSHEQLLKLNGIYSVLWSAWSRGR